MTKRGHGILGRCGAVLLCTTSLVALGLPLAAHAQEAAAAHAAAPAALNSTKYNFAIPAGSLDRALASWSKVTSLKFGAEGGTIGRWNAPAVAGSYTAEEALRMLLSGSNLGYSMTGKRTVTIYDSRSALGARAQATTVLDTIDVTGNQGTQNGSPNQTVITSADLERKNATDIRGVFTGEPKIAVGSSLPMSQKVYVQGIEETNLAVTIDGARQNNKIFHHNATNLVDPTLLKSVRVDAGVAPADAGPGALAGSIAYETKSARDLLEPGRSVGGFAKTSFNTNSLTAINGVSAYGQKNGFEVLGYLNYGKGNEFTAGNDQKIVGTSTDFLSGIGKIAYQAQSGDRLELSYDRIVDDAARPFRPNIGSLTNFPAQIARDFRLDRKTTVLTYTDATPEGWWNPKGVLAYSDTEIKTPVPAGGGLFIPGQGDADTFNGKFENKFPVTWGSVTAGFDYYSNKAKYFDRTFTAEERSNNAGLYAQARLEPTDRARVSFGGRADQQTFTGTRDQKWTNSGLSGNVSGEYDVIAQLLTAKAGYSHVWAGVPLAEPFIMNNVWNYGTGPRVTTADNYTAGLVAKYNGFTLEGTIFKTRIESARQAAFASVSPVFGLGGIRARDVESRGYEIGAGYSWGPGFLRVKFADIDVDIDGRPGDSDTGNYLATPMGQILTFTGAHTFERIGVTVGGDIEVAASYDRVPPGSKPLPSYEVANFYVEYKTTTWPNLTLRAQVNNLFDATYASRATYGQEFGNVIPLYESGRAFILSAMAKF